MAEEQLVEWLKNRYPRLELVRPSVFRAIDSHEGRPFAVRYFDVDPDIAKAAANIGQYQEELLGSSYFERGAAADLRWNHYLYFVAKDQARLRDFDNAKIAIESNREYARKLVVDQDELKKALSMMPDADGSSDGPLADPVGEWLDTLESHHLSFIVDDGLTVPDVTREVEEGTERPLVRPPLGPRLADAELKVLDDEVRHLTIRGFRPFPLRKEFEFSRVNLISGVNGVGKTSLLEAIEYLFCGKTMRPGPLLPRTSIAGVLANCGLTLETKSTTPSAQLRARHLIWYGKSELRALRLHESFAKFNFLDADAAVRLSVDQSRDQLTEDLAQLLLGAEAAKVLDRCGRVAKQLSDRKTGLEEAIEARGYRRADAISRLAEIKAKPTGSDQLFIDLSTAFGEAGARTLPRSKAEAFQVSTEIDRALLDIEMLGPLSTRLRDAIGDDAQAKLTAVENVLVKMQAEASSRAKSVAAAVARKKRYEDIRDSAEELAKIQQSGLPDLLRSRETLALQLEVGILAEAAEAIGTLAGRKAKGKFVSEAAKLSRDAVTGMERRTAALSSRLVQIETTQTTMRSLRQRLHAAAKEVIGQSVDKGRCPVCGAQYRQSELQEKLANAMSEVVTEESASVRAELSSVEAERRQAESDRRALATIETYFGKLAETTTVAEAKDGIANDQRQMKENERAMESIEQSLKSLGKKGWTAARWELLCSKVNPDAKNLSQAWLEKRRAAIVAELDQAAAEVAKYEGESAAADVRLVDLLSEHAIESRSVSEAIQSVRELVATSERRKQAFVSLGRRLKLSLLDDGTAAELQARLQRARAMATDLRTAVEKERQDEESLARETKLIKEIDDDIAGLRVRLGRVDRASEVIGDLLRQQTERQMTDEVQRDNAGRIGFAFSRIHSPNEFDVVSDGNFEIVRRGAGKVELTEMSSGQRAAYALSLFLAMNSRLGAGPNVILFDDPIAHVDDINTLSFLDYLRDLAMESKRQIFFATADAKIASLFVRKFRFLGEGFRQVELTRA